VTIAAGHWLAYVIEVIGWRTSMKLRSELEGIQVTVHGNIKITIFCLTTIYM